jgi:hypothetical protein
MLPSDFMRFGYLSFINRISKIEIDWHQQPLAENVLKFNMMCYFFENSNWSLYPSKQFIFTHFSIRHPVAARALADHSFLVFYISILFF